MSEEIILTTEDFIHNYHRLKHQNKIRTTHTECPVWVSFKNAKWKKVQEKALDELKEVTKKEAGDDEI